MTEEEWKKAEVLLEEIKSSVKAVAEGHDVIRREMGEMKSELMSEINFVKSAVKFLSDKVDKIDRDLKETREELKETREELKETREELREVKEKVDKIDQTLEEHVKLPAHVLTS